MKKAIAVAILCTATITAQAQTFFKDTHGKWGLKDANCSVLVPGKYDVVVVSDDSRSGLAISLSGGNDKAGEAVRPSKDSYASFFNIPGTLAAVNTGGVFNSLSGQVEGGKWGFIDKTGKEIVPPKYDDVSFNSSIGYDLGFTMFREKLIPVRQRYKWGFIDKKGKEIVPPRYDKIDKFSGDMIAVNIGYDGMENVGKWGFIDETGREIIPVIYDFADPFSEGLAAVAVNNKISFINKTGKEIIPAKYDYAFPFSEGLAAVGINNKYGFINKKGEAVIALQYDWVLDFENGKAKVTLDGKTFYIDKTGKEIKE